MNNCIRCGAPVEAHPSSLCTEAQLLHAAPARSPLDSAEALVQRHLDSSARTALVARLARGTPRPAPLAPGEILTVWASDGLPASVDGVLPLLARIRPAGVQLHAGPQGLAEHLAPSAERVRRAVPGVRLWVGVAWDGWVDDVDAGADVRRIVDRVYLPAARAAHAVGAELFVVNSEAAGKVHPAAARRLGACAIDSVRAECPGLLLGHTAYDHPHYHPEERDDGAKIDADDEGYPWSVYLGAPELREVVPDLVLPETGPVDVELPQRYGAPPKDPVTKKQPMAPPGALLSRVKGSEASFARAAALGWIDPRVPVRPYLQAHHVRAQDTAGVAAGAGLAALWASPTRLDVEGTAALDVLARGRRGELGAADLASPVVVAWAQGRLGLVPDAAWGPLSSAACATWQRAHRLTDSGRLDVATLVSLRGAA